MTLELTKSHSAWSESSAARLRPRGRHRTGEKLGLGHLRRSKGEARRAEAKLWVGFLVAKGPKGEARKAEQNAGANQKRRAFHLLPGRQK